MTNTHPFESVRRFMLAGEQKIDGSDEKQTKLYVKLITEEFVEFIDALMDENEVEQLDACCDMIYVIAGYAHSKGWDIIGAMDEVCRSNNSKVDIESGKLLKREDGKVLKPESYFRPELSEFINR